MLNNQRSLRVTFEVNCAMDFHGLESGFSHGSSKTYAIPDRVRKCN